MNKDRFHRLLRPKSIVVFGRKWVDAVITESRKFGFDGEIWAVHPDLETLAGVQVYRSIDQLPGIPDAAYIAVNAEIAIKTVSTLYKLGCGGVVLFASGFGELGGAGGDRQRRLVDAAGDMPVIGPNCYGFLNAVDKAILWPDQHGLKPVDRGVAILTQSGNIGVNLTMQQRGVPIAYLCTMGNQAMVNIADAMDVILDDSRVTAIGLHIEAINDIAEFDRVARRALSKRVPIVAIKSGRSEKAAEIAMSHTSSLAGSDALFDALFTRVGIARVNTITEFLESLKLLSIIGPLSGNRISSMSCSGGEAGMIADLIENRLVTFPEMEAAHAARVRATLNDYVNVANPLDYHTFIWGDLEKKTATFTAMMAGGYDATMLLCDWPNFDGADPANWDSAMLALAEAKDSTGGNAIVLASMQECLPPHAIDICIDRGLAPMIGLDTCLTALDAACKIGIKMQEKQPRPLHVPGEVNGQSIVLDEWNAKYALAECGLKIPNARLVVCEDEALEAADLLGFPLVLKGVGRHLTHKSEFGAVAVGLQDARQLQQAFARMSAVSERFLIEQMVTEFVAELIIGVTRDRQFGPSLLLGAGGVFVELMKDSATLLLPTSRAEVKEALLGLNISGLLKGWRGKPAGDLEAAIDAVLAVASYVSRNATTIQELDVNPLMVCPDGQGAIAVDALIRIKKPN